MQARHRPQRELDGPRPVLPMTHKDVRAGLAVGALASLAIAGAGLLLHGWAPGPDPGHEWSHGLDHLIGPWSLAAGAAVLLLLAPRPRQTFLLAVPVVPLPLMIALVTERQSYTDPAHDGLWPVVVALWLLGSFMLHVPLLLLNSHLRPATRASATEGEDERE